jgi:hypothetical protein
MHMQGNIPCSVSALRCKRGGARFVASNEYNSIFTLLFLGSLRTTCKYLVGKVVLPGMVMHILSRAETASTALLSAGK